MKHQSPNLNTLSLRILPLPSSLRIHKRRMRNPSRSPIQLRIKTFDQCHNIGSLSIAIIPFVLPVWLDGVRFTLAVGVDEFYGDEVAVGYGMGVCDGERVFVDCFYGAPDVDNLVAPLE